MTDKQIIETLRNIKEHCNKRGNCKSCQFDGEYKFTTEARCVLTVISHYLGSVSPYEWDMEKIERIIND